MKRHGACGVSRRCQAMQVSGGALTRPRAPQMMGAVKSTLEDTEAKAHASELRVKALRADVRNLELQLDVASRQVTDAQVRVSGTGGVGAWHGQGVR